MIISDAEKLILIMLSEIHENLKIKNGVDPKLVQAALYSGNAWGIKWQYPGIFEGASETPPLVREVVDILDMWCILEDSYTALSPTEKSEVAASEAIFAKDVKFKGFDGNYETEEMNICNFLIKDLHRFQQFKGRDLNSHMPLMGAYRRMLSVFLPLRPTIGTHHFSTAAIIRILKEAAHPDNR